MHALLSIRPKYVEAILDGEKKYEFRKSIFKKDNNIEKVFIYSTTPAKKIVGAFQIGGIIEDHPSNLWNKLSAFSGLKSLEFFKYFSGNEFGFAIKIINLERFDNPIDPHSIIPNFKPPQSFYYLKSDTISRISALLQ
jgi:type I restriction enzyme S subunit